MKVLAFKMMVVGVVTVLLSACEKPPPSTEDRVDVALRQLEEARLFREAEDKALAPFDSSLRVGSLSTEDKMRLCGADYRKIAVGWPIRKALACSGKDLYVVSETAGGIRIWQHCDGSGRCLTVGERSGYVSTWNH